MLNRWTLHVEHFGRIRQADIKVAPMMLFVGPNNTGKSYMVSLLWRMLDIRGIVPLEPPRSGSYAECDDMLRDLLSEKRDALRPEFAKSLFNWLNEWMTADGFKQRIARDIFNSDQVTLGALRVDIDDALGAIPISWRKETVRPVAEAAYVNGEIQISYSEKRGETGEGRFEIIKNLIGLFLSGHPCSPDTAYLPASRTGFILSYRSLITNMIDMWSGKKRPGNTLPQPAITFMKDLIDEHKYRGQFAEIAEMLEEKVIEGKIVRRDGPIPEYFYRTADADFPFYLTSSLITEVAPLIIFLQKFKDLDYLIFEEPESHLHLKVQRILAKYLVKLVNNDLNIWMTTHGDTFFQQINNLIVTTEERREKLKALGYADDEMILPEDIAAYEFRPNPDGMTDVVPLEVTKDGIPVPSMNETLWHLSEETLELESEDDD